jgi:hypothetical protein
MSSVPNDVTNRGARRKVGDITQTEIDALASRVEKADRPTETQQDDSKDCNRLELRVQHGLIKSLYLATCNLERESDISPFTLASQEEE